MRRNLLPAYTCDACGRTTHDMAPAGWASIDATGWFYRNEANGVAPESHVCSPSCGRKFFARIIEENAKEFRKRIDAAVKKKRRAKRA